MSSSRLRSALFIAATLAAPALHGQELVRPGSTVRLTLIESGAPLTGTLSAMTDEAWSVTLADGQVRRVDPRGVSLTEVEVRGRYTVRGALIGGGVGLLGALLLVSTDDECVQDVAGLCDVFVDVANDAAIVLGTVGGAALGALIGTAITSRRWVPGVVAHGGGAVAFRWRLATGS